MLILRPGGLQILQIRPNAESRKPKAESRKPKAERPNDHSLSSYEKKEYAAIHHRGYYRHRLCGLFVLEGVAVAVGQG